MIFWYDLYFIYFAETFFAPVQVRGVSAPVGHSRKSKANMQNFLYVITISQNISRQEKFLRAQVFA